jgi:hypothetical protein
VVKHCFGAGTAPMGESHMPNFAPSGTDLTRSVPRSYTLNKSDFGFSDTDRNVFAADSMSPAEPVTNHGDI